MSPTHRTASQGPKVVSVMTTRWGWMGVTSCAVGGGTRRRLMLPGNDAIVHSFGAVKFNVKSVQKPNSDIDVIKFL